MTTTWLDPVAQYYELIDDREYLRHLLANQLISGAFIGDELVGFIGQHAEGAMGLLVVLPQYRRQGIAAYLVGHLANQLLSQGLVPYDHIVVGNQASEALQRQLGNH